MKYIILSIWLTSGADLTTTCIGFNKGLTEGNYLSKGIGNSCGKAAVIGVSGAVAKSYITYALDKSGHKKLAKYIGIGFSITSTHAVVTNTIKIGKK